MNLNEWKLYQVKMKLSWMKGVQVCDADLSMQVSARSAGHAISRAVDQVREWFRGDIDDANAEGPR